MSRTWRMVIDWAPMVPANEWYKGHWSKKAGLVTEWRTAALQAARFAKLPKGIEAFTLTVQARSIARPAHWWDADAFAPASKAICDGLVTGKGKVQGYGLTPDDSPDYFGGTLLLPTVAAPKGRHDLAVLITEVPKESLCRIL